LSGAYWREPPVLPLVPLVPEVEPPPEPLVPTEAPLPPDVLVSPLREVEPVVVARSRVPVDTDVPVVERSRVPVETETPVRVELTPRFSTATPPVRCTLVRRTETLEGSSTTRLRPRTTTLRVGLPRDTYFFFFVTLRTVVGASSETSTLRRRVTETLGCSVVRLWIETPSRRDSVLTPTPTRVRLLVPTFVSERVLAPTLASERLLAPERSLDPVFMLDPEFEPELVPGLVDVCA
jgi:hypothetical protein